VTDLVVRDAREDDAEEFVRAYEAAWDAGLAEIVGAQLATLVTFEAQVQSFHDSLAKVSPDARIVVAERPEEIVGIAICRREGRTCELAALYVVPGAWGSGAARMLLDAVLTAMRERGAEDAFVWVGEANARARRFYEREGGRLMARRGSAPSVLANFGMRSSSRSRATGTARGSSGRSRSRPSG
jgi:ribosomal protein S18 acetylase RimI-like enzyme